MTELFNNGIETSKPNENVPSSDVKLLDILTKNVE
jgi:hypothetical protein